MRTPQNDSEFRRPPEEFPSPAAQFVPPPPEYGDGEWAAPAAKKKKKYHWLAAALAAGLLSTVAMFGETERALLEPFVSPAPVLAEASAAPEPTPVPAPAATPTPEIRITPAPTAAPTAEPTATPTAEPTAAPTAEPTPSVEAVFYRTSEVYHSRISLNVPRLFEAVTFRLWDGVLQETIWEHALTEEELAQGVYELSNFDLAKSEFAQKHWDRLMEGYEPDPVLEVVYTVRTAAGPETFTERFEVVDELRISVRYDLKDPEEDLLHYFLEETTYPDCFVLRIDPSPFGELNVIYGEDAALRPGDVAVTLTVDGQPIPAETCRLEVTSRTRGDQTLYAYAFVMPRPASFPDHGTADVRIMRKLLSFDLIVVKPSTLTY